MPRRWKRPAFVFKIMYPVGVLISKIPTLAYGLHELNPKKQVWTVKYHQVPPNVIWFTRYPNHLHVEHIGTHSYSANAIEVNNYDMHVWIGDECKIASNLKIIYKNYAPTYTTPPKIVIENNVFIGKDVKLLVGNQGLKICSDVTIGAGSIVTKDITEKGMYMGIPARRVKE